MKVFNLLFASAIVIFVSSCESSSSSSVSNKNVQSNSNTYASDSNKDSYPSQSANISISKTSPSATPAANLALPNSPLTGNTSSMSEEEKYKLFYAASKSGDGTLVLKISQKIGINDADNHPMPSYQTFWEGYTRWASKDKSFAKMLDTKEKAKDYVNSRLQPD